MAMAELAAHLLEYARRSAPWMPVILCGTDYLGTLSIVSGRSMQPTFNPSWPQSRDVVLLDKWSARRRQYQRGDVVVIQSPCAPRELMTKRVLGLSGDWVYKRGSNRELLHIPAGHVWVEGDNAENSNDSNSFGAVPAALVQAQVRFKVWPLSEASYVERRVPPRERVICTGDDMRYRQ
ncbi:hypothetical protein AB1Y20_003918 [Prymnesium parvum]|uniref:Mitochondrial inner membrane protease subunit 2 n=1 Tax=Prymnesium parvum TaxID=97485 RepID=A0AB34J889_PRYPA